MTRIKIEGEGEGEIVHFIVNLYFFKEKGTI